MANKCTVCAHPERKAIDHALISGQSNRSIAAQYGLAVTSVRRHKENHLSEILSKSQEIKEIAHADSLVEDLQTIRETALGFLSDAKLAKDMRAAAPLITSACRVIELLAEVRGDINRQSQVTISNTLIVEIQAVVLQALKPYPEARQAVVNAIRQKEME